MPFLYIIIYSIVTFGFSYVLFKIGRAMFKLSSVKAALEKFEKNPTAGTRTEKYFYGWSFPINRSIMKSLTQGSGDKLITLWFKANGVLFMILAIGFIVGTFSGWYFVLMG